MWSTTSSLPHSAKRTRISQKVKLKNSFDLKFKKNINSDQQWFCFEAEDIPGYVQGLLLKHTQKLLMAVPGDQPDAKDRTWVGHMYGKCPSVLCLLSSHFGVCFFCLFVLVKLPMMFGLGSAGMTVFLFCFWVTLDGDPRSLLAGLGKGRGGWKVCRYGITGIGPRLVVCKTLSIVLWLQVFPFPHPFFPVLGISSKSSTCKANALLLSYSPWFRSEQITF